MTVGLHCIACDADLGDQPLDDELCSTCLAVVAEDMKEFYNTLEEDALLKLQEEFGLVDSPCDSNSSVGDLAYVEE